MVQISLDDDCSVAVQPDQILEAPQLCAGGDLVVERLKNGVWVRAVFNKSDDECGGTYTVRVRDRNTGNSCWGKVLLEDKWKPTIDVENITLTCADKKYDPVFLYNCKGFKDALPTVWDNCSDYDWFFKKLTTAESPCDPKSADNIAPRHPNLQWFDTWIDLDCKVYNEGDRHDSRYYSAVIERKWQAVDACGNLYSKVQYIYFKRFSLRSIGFPEDVHIDCSDAADADDLDVTGRPAIWDRYWKRWVPLEPNPNAATVCEFSVTFEDDKVKVCDGTFKILRTWTVIDWCANSQRYDEDEEYDNDDYVRPNHTRRYDVLKHTQLIKVVDETGPIFPDVDDPIEIAADAYKCEACNPDLPSLIIDDNCSRITAASAMVIAYGYSAHGEKIQLGMYQTTADLKPTGDSGDKWHHDTLADFRPFTVCFPAGEHEVIFSAKDHCGNTSTLYRKLTVVDKTPPQPICHELTQVALGADGQIRVPADRFDNGSYDNCGPVYFKVKRMDSDVKCLTNGTLNADGTLKTADRFDDYVKFCCSDIGGNVTVILRIYTQKPAAGPVDDTAYISENDYNECMVQVLVEDKLPPSCVAPAHVTVWCDEFDPSLWPYGTATASDNCEEPELTEVVNKTKYDSLCKRGTIVRTWTAKDKSGRTSRCTQNIIIKYREAYTICFPADIVTTTCDKGGYTEPTFTGEDCELLAKSHKDDTFFVVDGACYKVERTWRVINWCTYDPNAGYVDVMEQPTGARVEINLNNSNAVVEYASCTSTTVVMRWAYDVDSDRNPKDDRDVYASGYEYKQIIKVLDNVKPVLTCVAPDPCDESPNNNLLWKGVWSSSHDAPSVDLCEGKKEVCITGEDACSDVLRFSYQLFLDIDGDGVMETVIHSNNLPAAGTVDGTHFFDNRPIEGAGKPIRTQADLYKWGLTVTGNKACVTWTDRFGTVPAEYPYGKHKIKWFVEDRCGNTTTCEYIIEVKDCKKPIVVCKNVNVNIMKVGDNGMVTLWASDFYEYGEDNCTPANKLKFAVTRKDAAKPANFAAAQSIVFDCEDVKAGTTEVWIWVQDEVGNADYCANYVKVQDNLAGACGDGTSASVAGVLKTEKTDGVEAAEVQIVGGANSAYPAFNLVQTTNATGNYLFSKSIPFSSNSTLTPVKDDNPLNGVTAYDLVLISKHILGLEPLSTPYKMIAADANQTGSITSADIVELRKLILGIYKELPNANSWRFVDKSYTFPNPSNPFSSVIPENKTIANIQANRMAEDFVGVKVGDVSADAIANNLMRVEDRSAGTLFFDVADRQVAAGEEVVVNFKAADKTLGYQFTMNFKGLEVKELLPGAGMSENNFAVFAAEKAVTTAVESEGGEFAIRFRATQAGTLSEMLKATGAITAAKAYDAAGEQYEVAFRFNGKNGQVVAGAGFELLQNTPNPVKDATVISFNLPEAGAATLRITNVEGRVIKQINSNFAKGLNTVTVNAGELQPGVLFYELQSGANTATKKMIVVDQR